MKILICVILFVSAANAQSGYYGRFWRGEKKSDYSEFKNYCDQRHADCFVDLVNRWLIPATPSYAAKEALQAYAPVLMPKKLQKKYHDEVALILYSSEKDYRQLRDDPNNLEGSTYTPIHKDIFNMGEKGTSKSSRSLVPKPYAGEIKLEGNLKEVSYEILAHNADLIGANASFTIIERRSDHSPNAFLENVNSFLNLLNQRKSAIVGAYSLITPNYIMLYTFSKNGHPWLIKTLRWLQLDPVWITPLKRLRPIQTTPLLYERIGYGEGGNLQFTPGVKTGTVDHYRLHK